MDTSFEIKLEKDSDRTIVLIKGSVNTETAPKLNEFLMGLDYTDLDLTIDLKKTEYITSAGLRTLLICRKKLTDETMRVIHANEAIRDIFAMTGFDSMIRLEKEEAFGEEYRLSLAALLKKRVESSRESIAYIYRDRSYSWNDVDKASHIVADALAGKGVKKGTHVGICSANSVNWIFTLLGIHKLGGIAILINPSLLPEEVCNLCDIADVTHLCYGEIEGKTSFDTYAMAFREKVNGGVAFDMSDSVDFTKKYHRFEEIKNFYRGLPLADDPATVIFSSGSTGKPKAILASSYSMISGTIPIIHSIPMSGEDISLGFLPMFHIFGFTMGISVPLITGYCTVLPRDKMPETMISLINQYGCTIFSTVPTMLLAMMASASFSSDKLKTLRLSFLGGSVTTREQLLMIKQILPNVHLCNVYGMSENAIVSITAYEDTIEHMSQTVGKPVDNLEIRIRTLDGEIANKGEQGEICIRSDTMVVCYYKLPVEKQPLDDEGWLCTGDLGYLDEEGYLHITGRIKDLIICGGENISPSEIAEVLSSIPEIADVKVLGIPDDIFGENVGAAVILKEKSTWNESSVRAYAANHLAKYKLPVHYVVFEAFPLLGSGKIDSIALKEQMIEKIGK